MYKRLYITLLSKTVQQYHTKTIQTNIKNPDNTTVQNCTNPLCKNPCKQTVQNITTLLYYCTKHYNTMYTVLKILKNPYNTTVQNPFNLFFIFFDKRTCELSFKCKVQIVNHMMTACKRPQCVCSVITPSE